MNTHLDRLEPYPFEKLRSLLSGVQPPSAYAPIRLSIGEPEHPTPAFILEAMHENLSGLSRYPSTQGEPVLREAIAAWLIQRFALPDFNPQTQVLPVNGSREALFAFAQCVLDSSRGQAKVLCPNPFYQIYEGATLLAGAQPVFLNQTQENGFTYVFDEVALSDWHDIQLVYVCSPGNPTGQVLRIEEWRRLFELSDKYGFVIAADECYSEIYTGNPPLGALEASNQLGRPDFRNLVVFSSLSKRSNVPGLRSGFVAGDADILKKLLLYRTYHGCAMSPVVQAVSTRAWQDEVHVAENRRLYRKKFSAVMPLLAPYMAFSEPQAGFYLWAKTTGSDTDFAKALFGATHVTVLPGSYLARSSSGENPGKGFVRIALVAKSDLCIEAAQRIAQFCEQYSLAKAP